MNVIKWDLTNWNKITMKQLKFISLVAHNLQSVFQCSIKRDLRLRNKKNRSEDFPL